MSLTAIAASVRVARQLLKENAKIPGNFYEGKHRLESEYSASALTISLSNVLQTDTFGKAQIEHINMKPLT